MNITNYCLNKIFRILNLVVFTFFILGNIHSINQQKTKHLVQFQGIKEIILKKNITKTTNNSGSVLENNILTQDMLSWTQTNYIIQHDFDLNGANITIPEGCVLCFQGGSLKNGSIILNNTHIIANNKIFNNIYIKGNLINEIRADWFTSLNECINNSKEVRNKIIVLSPKEYHITRPIVLTEGVILQGYNKNEWDDLYATSIIIGDNFVGESMIYIGEKDNNHNVKISNINIRSTNNVNGITIPYRFYGLELNNVYVYNANKAFSFNTFWTSIINRCNSYNSKYGFYLEGQTTTSLNFNNCVVFGGETAFHINIALNGTSFTNCAIDGSDIGFDIIYGKNIAIENITIEQFNTNAIRMNDSIGELYVKGLEIGANTLSDNHIIDIKNAKSALFVNCGIPSSYMPSNPSYYGINIGKAVNKSNVIFLSCNIYEYKSPSFSEAIHINSGVYDFKVNGIQRFKAQTIEYPYGSDQQTQLITSEIVHIKPIGGNRTLKANPIFKTTAKAHSIITLVNIGEHIITLAEEGDYYGKTGVDKGTVIRPNEVLSLLYNGTRFYVLNRENKTTKSRQNLQELEAGKSIFDKTLNKPIWWTGSKWVDATGTEVPSRSN